jgi:hypothetical protein
VLEEGNAQRMLAELVRVTKPSGRVAVMVRALDIPWVINVPLRHELKTKAEIPHGFVAAEGCADGGPYRRFHETGLTQVQMFPQFAASNRPDTTQAQFAHSAIVSTLTPQETQECRRRLRKRCGANLFYCAAVSLCSRNQARDNEIGDRSHPTIFDNGISRVSLSKWTDDYERVSINVEAYHCRYCSNAPDNNADPHRCGR